MPYVLYGLRWWGPGSGEPEREKVATFSDEDLANTYVRFSETKTSRKLKHWYTGDRKYYKWSVLHSFGGHEIDWEDGIEVPHNPVPEGS